MKIFTKLLLWNNYSGVWPTNGPAAVGGRANGTFEIVPALRTAGHQYRDPAVEQRHGHHRPPCADHGTSDALKIFLAMTFLLGFTFVGLQATEYHEAYTELGLQLGTASTARPFSC